MHLQAHWACCCPRLAAAVLHAPYTYGAYCTYICIRMWQAYMLVYMLHMCTSTLHTHILKLYICMYICCMRIDICILCRYIRLHIYATRMHTMCRTTCMRSSIMICIPRPAWCCCIHTCTCCTHVICMSTAYMHLVYICIHIHAVHIQCHMCMHGIACHILQDLHSAHKHT